MKRSKFNIINKLFLLLLIIFPLVFQAQGKNFFNKGKVEINQSIEKIPLSFVNDIPIVSIEIEGEFYNFIFDTGAPLVISNKIYDRLNLKTKTESEVADSHKEKRVQKFTFLPKMKAGNVLFKDFGAVVVDFEDPVFRCYNIEGILGANQMAKLYWKVDYQNNDIEVTENLKNFNPDQFNYKISFKPSPQKTPYINIKILNETKELTFDTGYAGSISINKSLLDLENPKIKRNLITKSGLSAVGMYGIGKNSDNYIFTTEDFSVGNIPVSKQIIETFESSVLGNTFLKNYIFIIDWKSNEILLKETNLIPIDYWSFGFSYRFVDGKVKVLNVYQNQNIPLHLEDEILSINDVSMENLSLEESCQYYLKSKEDGKKELQLKVKRGNEILYFNVKKQNFYTN